AYSDRATRLAERDPRRVPQLCQGEGRMLSERRYAMRDDQPTAPVRTQLLLMGVASVHDECRPSETLVEEPHVGIDPESIGHLAIAIGDHAVGGDDGVAFNANPLRHARRSIPLRSAPIRTQIPFRYSTRSLFCSSRSCSLNWVS